MNFLIKLRFIFDKSIHTPQLFKLTFVYFLLISIQFFLSLTEMRSQLCCQITIYICMIYNLPLFKNIFYVFVYNVSKYVLSNFHDFWCLHAIINRWELHFPRNDENFGLRKAAAALALLGPRTDLGASSRWRRRLLPLWKAASAFFFLPRRPCRTSDKRPWKV